jgi:hypothetical protein
MAIMFSEQTTMSDDKIVTDVGKFLVLCFIRKIRKITTTPINPMKLVRAKEI